MKRMQRRFFLTASILAAVLAGVLATGLFAQEAEGKKYALVVGINKYQAKNLRKLNYAVNDAKGVADVLTKANYEVILLTDDTGKENPGRKPSQENIERHLAALLKKCNEKDMVLVTLAGHGIQIKEEAYFCPEGADTKKQKTLVSLKKMYEDMADSGAGSKILMVDACRNELGRDVADPLNSKKATPPRGILALFSCSADERAYEPKELKHGVFFYCVLKALQGEADEAQDKEGRVDFYTLAKYVCKAVPNTLKELEFTEEQNPTMSIVEATSLPVLVGAQLVAQVLPELIQLDLGGDVKLQLKRIPYKKGDPAWLAKPYYMGVTEVTQAQYEKISGKNPSHFSFAGKGAATLSKAKVDPKDVKDFPVDSVSWNDAVTFCAELTNQQKMQKKLQQQLKGKKWVIELPSEDEWEYCCKAGKTTAFAFGDTLTTKQANFYAKTVDRTVKVGSYPPNAFGLYDMHGNVWEWCKDEVTEGRGMGRVLRGGAWNEDVAECRSDNSSVNAPDSAYFNQGFRVILRLTP